MENELYITGSIWTDPMRNLAYQQDSDKDVTRFYIEVGQFVPCVPIANIHISDKAFEMILEIPNAAMWLKETVTTRMRRAEGHILIGAFDQYQVRCG